MAISPIVTLIYWSVLSKELFQPEVSLDYKITGSISHSLNMIFPILDLFLSKTKVSFIWCLAPISISALYMLSTVLFHLLRNEAWPYTFLVMINGGEVFGIRWGNSIAFFAGFCVLLALFHFLAMKVADFRDYLSNRRESDSDVKQAFNEDVSKLEV